MKPNNQNKNFHYTKTGKVKTLQSTTIETLVTPNEDDSNYDDE